jgi:hypothetical protein
MDNLKRSVYQDIGQEWLVKEGLSLKELGENEIKLRYLEKTLKSKRRLEQREALREVEEINEKYKYDKNAVVGRKFPYTADEFKYPNIEKPKSLYIKSNDEYGSKKPNQLELPDKYFPINNTFSKEFSSLMFKNNSLNTAQSRSKVHANLDSVV